MAREGGLFCRAKQNIVSTLVKRNAGIRMALVISLVISTGCASLKPGLRNLPTTADEAFTIEDRPMRNTTLISTVVVRVSMDDALIAAERSLRSSGFEVRAEGSTADRRCGMYPLTLWEWPFWACFYFRPRSDENLQGRVVVESWKNFGVITAQPWNIHLVTTFQNQLRGLAETRPRSEEATGTCFAVRPDGVLLTAYHVVEDAKSIRVQLADGTVTEGNILTFTAQNDLAILRVDTRTPHFLPLAPPGSVRTGDHVFTMGYPAADLLGQEPKFTEGSVSALSGLQGEAALLQMSVPIQPGNSGGPLVNERGEVVGVVTSTAAVRAFFAVTGTFPQNVNWAVKADFARPLYDVPVVKSVSMSRSKAIETVRRAICMVETNSQ